MKNTIKENLINKKILSYVKKFFTSRSKPRSYNLEAGFTLIELLAAISIFIVVVSVVVAILISMIANYRRSLNAININNAAYFAMETMAKEMRTGKNFSCTSGPSNDCSKIEFTNYHNDIVSYELITDQIKKTCVTNPSGICAGGEITPSSSSMRITILKFNMDGIGQPDNKQSKVTITIKAETPASAAERAKRDIILQTTVSSRNIDS